MGDWNERINYYLNLENSPDVVNTSEEEDQTAQNAQDQNPAPAASEYVPSWKQHNYGTSAGTQSTYTSTGSDWRGTARKTTTTSSNDWRGAVSRRAETGTAYVPKQETAYEEEEDYLKKPKKESFVDRMEDTLQNSSKDELRTKTVPILIGVAAGLIVGALVGASISGSSSRALANQYKQESEETQAKNEEMTAAYNRITATESTPAAEQLQSDTWATTLVNESHAIDANYTPTTTTVGDKPVDSRIAESLQNMIDDAKNNDNVTITVLSGYRTYDEQYSIFNETFDNWYYNGYAAVDAFNQTKLSVATPGHSEHETGLAVDLVDPDNQSLDDTQNSTASAQWLAQNAYKYGFILRYPQDKTDVTGVSYESWHYRYVGEDAAKTMQENNWTLEEYITNTAEEALTE